MGVGLDRFDKKKKEIPKEEPDPVEEEEEEEQRRKGLGDELEEFQVNLIKGVTLADQRNKEKREKEEKKSKKETTDSIKYYSKSKDNKWLSSFNKGSQFEYEGYVYPTVEHAFHAQKIDPKDPKAKEYKTKLSDKDLEPNEAKKLGGKKSFKENKYKFRPIGIKKN